MIGRFLRVPSVPRTASGGGIGGGGRPRGRRITAQGDSGGGGKGDSGGLWGAYNRALERSPVRAVCCFCWARVWTISPAFRSTT